MLRLPFRSRPARRPGPPTSRGARARAAAAERLALRRLRWWGGLVAGLLVACVAVGPGLAADGSGGAPAAGARASGLPWASGAFSHDAKRTVTFAERRGRAVDVLAVFPTRDSWDTLLEDWWMSPSAVPDGFHGTLNVGLPMFPDNGNLESVASGADDANWEKMGKLIASKYPDAWVRPGWEMNIPNWPWHADSGNVETYKKAFQHASTALKKGGPGLRITFNPNEGRGGSLPDATLAYPGDAYVDDIGLDAYDWDPPYRGGGWEEHRTHPGGWDSWGKFARDHHKTFSVPEWGVIPGGQNSGGDDPEYIDAVLGWMGKNADIMSFDTYFEETEPYCRCALSLNPEANRAYAAMMPKLAALKGGAREAAPTGAPEHGPASPTNAPTGERPGGDAQGREAQGQGREGEGPEGPDGSADAHPTDPATPADPTSPAEPEHGADRDAPGGPPVADPTPGSPGSPTDAAPPGHTMRDAADPPPAGPASTGTAPTTGAPPTAATTPAPGGIGSRVSDPKIVVLVIPGAARP